MMLMYFTKELEKAKTEPGSNVNTDTFSLSKCPRLASLLRRVRVLTQGTKAESWIVFSYSVGVFSFRVFSILFLHTYELKYYVEEQAFLLLVADDFDLYYW